MVWLIIVYTRTLGYGWIPSLIEQATALQLSRANAESLLDYEASVEVRVILAIDLIGVRYLISSLSLIQGILLFGKHFQLLLWEHSRLHIRPIELRRKLTLGALFEERFHVRRLEKQPPCSSGGRQGSSTNPIVDGLTSDLAQLSYICNVVVVLFFLRRACWGFNATKQAIQLSGYVA